MRVISGEKGGRHLLAPSGNSTRPTSDRVREAMFSMLESRQELEGAHVWDLFAGSGALGIEALSRGAAHTTFVDQAPAACSVVKSNLATLGYGPDRATVVRAEALGWAQSSALSLGNNRGAVPRLPGGRAPDLVLADPPYAWSFWTALLSALQPLQPLLLVETGHPVELAEGWEALKVKRYGTTLVTLTRLSREPGTPSRPAPERRGPA